ncbi:MAG: hypothetical protein ACKODZ_07775, partial [Verrucomicrobiota bacterium]
MLSSNHVPALLFQPRLRGFDFIVKSFQESRQIHRLFLGICAIISIHHRLLLVGGKVERRIPDGAYFLHLLLHLLFQSISGVPKEIGRRKHGQGDQQDVS